MKYQYYNTCQLLHILTQTLQNLITFLLTKRRFTDLGTKLQILSQQLSIFTKHLLSVTEVQKCAKTFLKFTNFDKEYIFRQNINNNRQSLYHS